MEGETRLNREGEGEVRAEMEGELEPKREGKCSTGQGRAAEMEGGIEPVRAEGVRCLGRGCRSIQRQAGLGSSPQTGIIPTRWWRGLSD